MRRPILLLSILSIALLSACKDKGPTYNGYIDADLTYLSSDFPGRLTQLAVHRGEIVHQNQSLFKLEQTSEQFSIEMSEFNHQNLLAQRQQLLDQIQYDEINYRRTLRMRKESAASQNDLDVAKKDLDVLNHQLTGLNFQIQSSIVDTANKKWQFKRKADTAPQAGFIYDTYYTEHEYVQAGQPILSLITADHIKVIFFVPEKDLSKIVLKGKIRFSDNNNPKLSTGQISYISNQAQYTPPIIYSRENRQELIFRVEAKLDNPDLQRIHLGEPVSLEALP